MPERILTLHPQGKAGVNIDKDKYDIVSGAIKDSLRSAGGESSFDRLIDAVHSRLEGKFDGSISWYVTTVKLDMEARGVLRRVAGSRPQRIQLAGDQFWFT